MSQVGRSRWAWWAWLLVFGGMWQKADRLRGDTAEPKSSPKSPAVLETYAKPGGQAYFALKLTPQLAQPKAQPCDVVVLFDTSASQNGAYRDKGIGALRSMLAALSDNDRVALLAVDVSAARLTPSLVPPSGGAIGQALAALDRRVPLGSTDMPEALDAALATWQGDNDAQRTRSVVYIGDGFSTVSMVPLETLHRIVGKYSAARVSFSSYAVGPRVNGELLGALANHTGGMLIADDNHTDRQFGDYLATISRAAVIWPTAGKWPAAMKDVFPRQMPPLRFDRDSVLVGTLDARAAERRQPLPIEVQAELAGKPVTLKWQAAPEQPLDENAYLAKVVELAAPSGGVALPAVGSAGLNELRRWVNFGAQQLARLGERALAMGQADEAAQLAGEAERLDPANAEADLVREAASRARRPAAADVRLARAPQAASPSKETEEPADGALVENIERQDRVVEGFLRADVNNALNQSSADMSVSPEATRYQLKALLDRVQHVAELSPEARAQMVEKIEAGLRAAGRMSALKTEQDLRRQQVEAEGEARERIQRQLFVQEQKVDQLMSRFNALMDEQRYRDAEVLADIAEELTPATPGLRTAELTARMTGYTADINAMRDMTYKGFVDAAFQIELSNVPTPDDPPILFPDPEVWQLLTERRKKYTAVDLTEHGPNETKILAALDEKTELDFSEQPLADAIDYLKNRHGIEIQFDTKALADAGVGSEVPVTRSLKGITLRSALKLLLGELDLTYVMRNEVLMITSKAEAENMLTNRVYPVADLVVPIAPPRNMSSMGGGGMGGGLLGTGMGGGMGGSMGGMGGGMGMGGMGMGGMGMGMGGGMGGGMGFF